MEKLDEILVPGLAPEKTRVVVAMSGGVDSSATAALLKDQGYDVIGVTLQLYDHGAAISRPNTCCAGRDIHDARNVADAIGIPHYVLDFEKQFKSDVINAFADSYVRGETPVPCVRCNETVKFRDLLEKSRELGARALVTGHYVRRLVTKDGPELHMGKDHKRDQSYFLFSMTRDQLDFLRFPLGSLSKDETRALARRFNLPVASKADSQDICFVPEGNYKDVLRKLRPDAMREGEIVDLDGNVLGRHDGTANYTVGQRRGLGISAAHPLYVVEIEPELNRVVIGPEDALKKNRLSIGGVNWLGSVAIPDDGFECAVKLRSTQPPASARVLPTEEGRADVILTEPQAGIAPGQACVFYSGERILGGGWILRDDQPN